MNRMKLFLAFSLVLVALTTSPGCYALASEPIKAVKKDTVYSNESFSITIPKGWEGNDTIGNGPVKDFRSMEIYNKFDDGAWVSIVKSAINVPFESPKQAAELSTYTREMPPDEALKYGIEQDPNYIGVVGEQDSVEIDGCPAYLTVYKNQADEDTLLEFQFCVITPWNKQLYYITHHAYYSTMSMNPQIGDECYDIIESIRFKRKE